MKGQIAKFSNGFRLESTRPHVVTHGWYASGKQRNGKPWSVSGFSIKGEDRAQAALHQNIRSYAPPGSTVEFSEVVAVEPVREKVPA